MRIVCPSCQAAYEVPDKLLSGSPRKVRCARCGADWVPEPVPAHMSPPAPAALPAPAARPAPEDLPNAPQPAAPPTPEPEADLPPPPPVRITPTPSPHEPLPHGPRMAERRVPAPGAAGGGRRLVVVAGVLWLASLAALAAAGWAAFAFREDIMALWAPSRRLYSLLGMA